MHTKPNNKKTYSEKQQHNNEVYYPCYAWVSYTFSLWACTRVWTRERKEQTFHNQIRLYERTLTINKHSP